MTIIKEMETKKKVLDKLGHHVSLASLSACLRVTSAEATVDRELPSSIINEKENKRLFVYALFVFTSISGAIWVTSE